MAKRKATDFTADNLTREETEMKIAFNLSVAALMLGDLSDRFPDKSRQQRKAHELSGKVFELLCDYPFKEVRHQDFWKSRKLQMALNQQIQRLYYRKEPQRDDKGRFLKG